MKKWVPWAGTYCLLEKFEDGYYINGIAVFVGPDDLKRAFDLLNLHLKETEIRRSSSEGLISRNAWCTAFETENGRKHAGGHSYGASL